MITFGRVTHRAYGIGLFLEVRHAFQHKGVLTLPNLGVLLYAYTL